MTRYSYQVSGSIFYSIGDTHARGREVIEFINRLEVRGYLRGERPAAFIQLGDLCDGFALPAGADTDTLRSENEARVSELPELGAVLFHEGNTFVDWDCNAGVRREMDARTMLDSTDPEIVTAVYHAFRSFETLLLYSRWQKAHDGQFHVILGNHDMDLLRGRCAYGRKQKYILLGLLGMSSSAVISHMTEGKTRRILRNPWLNWLYRRPHLLLSGDTVYMHGGPTAALSEELKQSGGEGFEQWLLDMDNARGRGPDHPAFTEHESFLSPDGEANDWHDHPERILSFLGAAGRRYLAVGHSPFLDFNKGIRIDLDDPSNRVLTSTPAQLPPDGSLIKHDTDLKRSGSLWACRHEAGTDIWTGIDVNLNEFPLRGEATTGQTRVL